MKIIAKNLFFTILVLLLLSIGGASPVYGEEDHVALWVGTGFFSIDSAGSSDSAEKSAYIDAIRSTGSPSGNGLGIFVDTSLGFLGVDGIGIGLARSQGSLKINKTIDPMATPANSTDDITIQKATRFSSNCVFFLKTIEFLTLGLGTEDGYFVFDTTTAGGQQQTKTFAFSFNYLHVSIAYLFGESDGPYISLVTNHITSSLPNMERGDFSGSTNAIVVGWIF